MKNKKAKTWRIAAFSILCCLLSVAASKTSLAYDFSATAPSGQTLYFNITSSTNRTVEVTSKSFLNEDYDISGDLTIPSTVEYNGVTYNVTSIGNLALCDCLITSINIPNTVTHIGSHAFEGCYRLTSIIIPNNVRIIYEYTFADCGSLTSIIIPDNVIHIGDYAFWECYGLESVSIGNGVTSIGERAFEYCSNITSINIPDNVTHIGIAAFHCCGFTSINIPDNVTHIGDYAFWECGLKSISIGDGVTSIGVGVFFVCDSLTSISIGNGVTSISKYAFDDHNRLSTIIIRGRDFRSFSEIYKPNRVFIVPYQYFDDYQSNWETYRDVIFPDSSMINLQCNNPSLGNVEGGGLFGYGDTITISAIPDTHCFFISWSDGDSHQNRQIIISKPMNLTATFKGESYNVLVYSNNAEYGNVSGGGQVEYKSECTLTATPKQYYRFLRWSNGVTDNPYTLTVYGETSLTAEFGIDSSCVITVTAKSADETMGSVNGGGRYTYKSECTLTATPKQYYRFLRWSNGVTENPYTLTVHGDTSLTAEFGIDGSYVFTVSVRSADETMGTVSGGGRYTYKSECTLTATPKQYHRFLRWSNGVTANPYTLTVYGDTSLTAVFEINKSYLFTTTVRSADETMGTVSGGGQYTYRSECTLTATPGQYYRFLRWSNGVTENPYTLTMYGDTSLTAVFEIDKSYTFTTTVKSADETMGTVSGGGRYTYKSECTLTATPKLYYRFLRWSNGVTENPYTLTVHGDTSLTAEFEIDRSYTFTTTVRSADETMGTVSGGGQYTYRSECTLTATPRQYYRFLRWSNGVTENPYTLTVYGDTSLTAEFEIDGSYIFTVSVKSADEIMGTVSGGGIGLYGQQIQIQAIPNQDYQFVQWNDGDTQSTRTITVSENAVYTAYFKSNTEGIDDISHESVSIHSAQGSIIIDGTNGAKVRVFDAMGRMIVSETISTPSTRIPLPTGVYLVRVGTSPARKVVVLR